MKVTRLRSGLQHFGNFLSGMVLPNIGAFIAWGLITALFIPSGWFPNEHLAQLVTPMINYLLPILIGFTGGKLVYGTRGGVVGALGAIGVVAGSEVPMFLGAMLMGPLGGLLIKGFDRLVEGKIRPAFQPLVTNFSAGILGGALTLLSYTAIGPLVGLLNTALANGMQAIIQANLLPASALVVEPAKVLFLNNALDHGILGPLGVQQAKEVGQSVLFLLVTNPGPGLGVLLAYWFGSKGELRQSVPGAVIIHFLGGIHEIYFPYVLMNPLTLLGVIAGGAAGTFTFTLFRAGLVATAAPGSIFAVLAMTPKESMVGVLMGILVSTLVSLAVCSLFVRRKNSSEALEQAQKESELLQKS